MNENELMSKLVRSKSIMQASDTIKSTNGMGSGLPPTSLQQFDTPNVKYNIPQEFLQEQQTVSQPYLSSVPKTNTKPVGVPTVDAIKNSKLPDEIKRLMIEHPITQPGEQQVSISNDLIERASRLMKRSDSNYVPESAKPKTEQQIPQGIDYKLLQKMIDEAVNNALKKSGVILESTEKTNELFSFRVGKHLFEGKITKVKKMS